MPGKPVGEQQDVSGLFLDDRLERVDEFDGEEAGAPGKLEQAEGEEAVDTLTEAGDEVGPLRVLRFQVRGFRLEPDAVGRDELCEDVLVAALFPAVLPDGLAPFGIGQAAGIGGHAEARLALRLYRDVPYRQTGQALERRGIELWPVDHCRLVRIERLAEHAAGSLLVFLAARTQRARIWPTPGPRGPGRGLDVGGSCRAHAYHGLLPDIGMFM